MSLPNDQFPIASKFFEEPIFNKDYYELLCDKFRSPHLWKWDNEKGWVLRKTVYSDKKIQRNLEAYSWEGNTKK